MGTLVCQSCNGIIEHFEDEKVTTLYSNCCGCGDKDLEQE